jgi:hypothetical protein
MIMASWFGKIRRTPVTVTFVILFFLGLGAATLFQAAMSYGILHLPVVQTMDRRYLTSARAQLMQLLFGLPAIVNLLVGVGLLGRKKWAHNLGIVVCWVHVLAVLIGMLISTISVFALTGDIFSLFTDNTNESTSNKMMLLILLNRLRGLDGSLHHLWGYAFVGCLLLKDRALKRYISSSIKQT